MTRVAQLNAAVDQVIAAHNRWAHDPQGTSTPSVEMERAIEDMWDVFQAGQCPQSHLPLNNAVAKMYSRFTQWQDGNEAAADRSPTDRFWGPLREVFELRSKLEVKPPSPFRPIAVLKADGATDEQIATCFYGFRSSDGVTYDEHGGSFAGPLLNSHGQIDYEKFAPELEKPHSVIPAEWVHPRERKKLEAVGYFDTTPAVQMGKPVMTPEQQEAKALDLLNNGGLLQQVAHCTGLTEDAITALCDRENIPVPVLNPMAEETSPEARTAAILGLIAEGKNDGQIVGMLRKQGMDGVNLGLVKLVRQKQLTPATV